MPVSFQEIPKNNEGNFKRSVKQRKTFVYSKRNSDLNFDEMYETLQPSVSKLVQQNRIQLISMNSNRSKDLVNKTQSKLVSYMRQKPGQKKYFTNTSSQNKFKFNIHLNPQQLKQNHQQIFDYTKLQQIIRSYEKNTQKQSPRFSGVLAEKVLRLTDRHSLTRPFTHRVVNTATAEISETSRNYLGWKAEKSKRRMKNMFS